MAVMLFYLGTVRALAVFWAIRSYVLIFKPLFPDDTFYSYAAKAGGFPTTPADAQDILRGVGLSGECKYRNLSRLELFLPANKI